MKPKQDPAELAAQQRERRLALTDQKTAGQDQSAGLTSDLRSVYGPSIFAMFGRK